MKTGVLAEPVLVGRERELVELEHHLELAMEGKGATVFVSGEAGAGKTRLTTEFLKRAKQKGVALLAGWCLSDAAVPYFPFVEAFDAYFSSSEEESADSQELGPSATLTMAVPVGIGGFGITAWLTGLKPDEKLGKPGAPSPQVWKDQLFSAVGKTLHSISAQSPLVLFIEDIHWADSASLALLHYLARLIGSEKILVLATFRSEELTADAEGHPHPLAEMMRLMRREDLFTEIGLPNLSQADVSTIVENMVGGTVQPELLGKLANESRGNALFVVESLRMLSERKCLIQENHQWRLAVDELGIPSKVKDIILRRLAVLKHPQRRVLDAASVIGEKFDVELLGTVLGQDSLDVLETLNVIAQSTSLVCVEENSYRFDHAKSREALYEEIPLPLKRGYHARVAERMEGTVRSGKLPLSDLAFHFTQAGNREKSLKYSLAAGEDALARYSNTEAIKHFRYVLQTVGEDTERADERAIALEGLGDAFFAAGLFEEAIKTYERLNSGVESSAVKLRALRKAVVCCYWRGESGHALELAAKAQAYAQADRLEYARLRLYKGFVVGRSLGKKGESLEDMSASLRVFEEEYSLIDIARALVEISFGYPWEDRLEDSLSAALRSVVLYGELGDLREQGFATGRLGTAFGQCGFFQEALDTYSTANKIDEKIGDYNAMAFHFMMSGNFLELMGNDKAAVVQSLKGVEVAEKTDAQYAKSLCYSNLVREYSKLGEIERAEEFSRKLEKLFDDAVALRSNNNAVIQAQFSKAFLFSSKGQWKEANEILEKKLNPEKLARRRSYAWVLEKQGRTEEAKKQLDEAKRISNKCAARFEHSNIQAYLLAPREIGVGEELNIRLDLVNVAKNPATLTRIEGLISPEFKAPALPSHLSQQNSSLEMNGRKLGPFQVELVKLSLQTTKPGVFVLKPQVVYIDDVGETKTCAPNPVTITVQPARPKYEVLPGRVPTGFAELDALLFGGIPQNYAVVLTSPSTDEKEQLIRCFLEAGASTDEITFHITAEAGNTKALAEQYPSNFYLFICNPQADAIVQSLPNVFKLKGIENLTDIDIALTKAFRTLSPSSVGPKRICIEIVSDALLQHHAVTTRRWLSALLPNLKSRGFTILAVIDPQMHPPEETQAVLGLFDGEISICEKETQKGTGRFLRIKRMSNQKYSKDETEL